MAGSFADDAEVVAIVRHTVGMRSDLCLPGGLDFAGMAVVPC